MPARVDLAAAAGDDRRSIVEAISRSRLLDLEGIRATLLRPDTLLVVYFVGERASYVWWLDEDSFGSHRLPGRKSLEGLTRKLRALLANPTAEAAQTLLALDSVSRLLLDPVPIRGKHRRLVLILDGPLQYLPFGAFSARPDRTSRGPSTGAFLEAWQPLLTERDFVVLPSISVLEALRQRSRIGRKTLAVLADPVFSAEDERVGRPAIRSAAGGVSAAMPAPASLEDLRRSAEDFALDGWRRLAGTRAEAIRITSLVAPDEQFAALDFAARRELALSGALADYRIVHFATHSLLHEEQPDLSGIVLSLVDERGRPQDGFLSAGDVLQMKLSAELVVLSGCRTALGRETRGEGLLGLAQSFLVAGARSLLVSLWDLDDEATSELMARFYHHLPVRGLSPPLALKAAQMSLLAEERFRAPYYWAPFILVGAADSGFSDERPLNNP
jgi:CHAT domain-containing protein